METREANKALKAVVQQGLSGVIAGLYSNRTAVRTITPQTEGEEAQTEAADVLVELAEANIKLLQAVMQEADDIRIAELAEEYNKLIARANKKIEAFVKMDDEEYVKPIPEQRQQSLTQLAKQRKKEDLALSDYADTMARFVQMQKEHPGTKIVEPVAGVLALKVKNPARVEIPSQEVLPA